MATARADVAHLLRRAGFGGTLAQIDEMAGADLPAIVDHVLDTSAGDVNARPPTLDDPNLSDWEKFVGNTDYWLDLSASTPAPLLEKMVLFWHGHVVVGSDKVGDAEYLWRMNSLQRRNALGNWRTLIKAASVEPAMLIYLDNTDNVAGSPNQNFARELLELFLLGVGNYSEGDVDAAARAWTGHALDDDARRYVFRADDHDGGAKTFMNVSRNWDGPDIIDFLFDDPVARAIVAAFLVRKLWAFFATPGTPDNVVQDLSTVLIDNNFEVRPLLRALFLRPEFYGLNVKQGLVRSPFEWLINLARQTGLRSDGLNPMWILGPLGQQPFDPPNVSGWRPNRYWLSSAASSQRGQWAGDLGYRLADSATGPFRDLPSVPIPQAVQAVFDRLGIDAPCAASRSALTNWWNAQRASGDGWYELTGVHQVALLLPELQLA